jgi:hypothetical protein
MKDRKRMSIAMLKVAALRGTSLIFRVFSRSNFTSFFDQRAGGSSIQYRALHSAVQTGNILRVRFEYEERADTK